MNSALEEYRTTSTDVTRVNGAQEGEREQCIKNIQIMVEMYQIWEKT